MVDKNYVSDEIVWQDGVWEQNIQKNYYPVATCSTYFIIYVYQIYLYFNPLIEFILIKYQYIILYKLYLSKLEYVKMGIILFEATYLLASLLMFLSPYCWWDQGIPISDHMQFAYF
jgi:hypothetical protein